MFHLIDRLPLRIKHGHSETGTAVWRGRRVFYKCYPDAAHYETEVRALALLRSDAPISFRFVDRLEECPASRTILFPKLLMDASQAAIVSASPESIVEAVCRQIAAEIDVVRAINVRQLRLRASEPWNFLRRIEASLQTRHRSLIGILPTDSETDVTFRYDSQLDNFLLKDRAMCTGIWSIDFSMWRRAHFAYPFSFLWHDILERPRPGLDEERLKRIILRHIRQAIHANGVDAEEAGFWLLANRAEALAHEFDGHRRRGHTSVAKEKLEKLTLTLEELAGCH